jgi:hypothetical protein
MIYKSNYNAEKHAEKYIILDWAGNIKTFNRKNIIAFDTMEDADQYLDKQIYKLSKSKEEKQIIKDDFKNDFEEYFYITKNEFQIKQCKEIFTNYICDPFGFSQAINI